MLGGREQSLVVHSHNRMGTFVDDSCRRERKKGERERKKFKLEASLKNNEE